MDSGTPMPWGPEALAAFALVLARVAGVVWPITAWGPAGLEPRARLLLAVAGALLLTPLVGEGLIREIAPGPDPAALARAAVPELLIGLAIGLAAALVIGAARQGGEWAGMAAGLSPSFELGSAGPGGADEPLTPIGAVYLGIALAAFLAIDGPLMLLDALVRSYRILPVATGPEWAAGMIGGAIRLALGLAAPVVVPLLLAQGATAFFSTAGGSSPWGSLAWPGRIVLGVVLVGLAASRAASALGVAWRAVAAGF